jgi:Arc/MetJ family transcription regulator
MRTTVTIDDDVLAAARQFADARGLTLGEALSQLARATLTERRRFGTRNGIVLLPADPAAGTADLDDVNALRDDA